VEINVDLIGYSAAALTTVSFVPQAIQTIRTRETHGISLAMYLMFTVGILLWLLYGVVLWSWPIMLANALTFVLALTILVLKLRYG